jgi:hypothetical protein
METSEKLDKLRAIAQDRADMRILNCPIVRDALGRK